VTCEQRDFEKGNGEAVERRDLMRKGAVGMAGVVGGHALGAAGTAAATGAAGGRDALSRLGLVYLSHVNDPATTSLFPGDPAFTLEVIATIPADGFYMQFVREGEHTGTHWGAPGHFQEGGLLADQLDAEDLFLPAVKIDIRAQSAQDVGAALRPHPQGSRGHPVDGLGGQVGHRRLPQSGCRWRHPPARVPARDRREADPDPSPRPTRGARH
jgi:hypothetical protein